MDIIFLSISKNILTVYYNTFIQTSLQEKRKKYITFFIRQKFGWKFVLGKKIEQFYIISIFVWRHSTGNRFHSETPVVMHVKNSVLFSGRKTDKKG